MKFYGAMRENEKAVANMIMRRVLAVIGGTECSRTLPAPNDAGCLLQWGYKPTIALKSAQASGLPYVILDMGYFDEFERRGRMSISFDGFHGLSRAVDGVLDMPPRPHPEIKDWKMDGENVIVCGQLPYDRSLFGNDGEAWMHRAATEAIETYGKPVHKRPHPRMYNPWEPQPAPLVSVLDNCHTLITFTSTAGVTGVLNGIPTRAMHKGSLAYPMDCGAERRQVPGREAWAHTLAHRDYNMMDDADLDAACRYIEIGVSQA